MTSSTNLIRRRGRSVLVLVAAGALLLGMAGEASAAYIYSTSRIYACVNNLTKVARIVVPRNGHTACRSGEHVVSWLKVGALAWRCLHSPPHSRVRGPTLC